MHGRDLITRGQAQAWAVRQEGARAAQAGKPLHSCPKVIKNNGWTTPEAKAEMRAKGENEAHPAASRNNFAFVLQTLSGL